MFPNDFMIQLKHRGATNVARKAEDKVTTFEFEGRHWACTDAKRRLMTGELADGYEMNYCVARYCDRIGQDGPSGLGPHDLLG